jgi:hypothetical protein
VANLTNGHVYVRIEAASHVRVHEFPAVFFKLTLEEKEHACALLVLRNMLTEGTETNSARRRNHLALISK